MSMSNMLGKLIMAGLVAKGVSMAGGKSGGAGGAGLAGALGGLLGGNKSGSAHGGGIAGALGGLLGGNQSGAGGLGGLLGSLAGGGAAAKQGGGIGDILGSFMGGPQQAAQIQPTIDQEQQAEILLRAMLNAAKSDGQIDKAEQQRIVEHLGDVSESEKQFLRDEMSAPLDTAAFIRSIPKGMEQQVYLVSLTSIDLDCKAEAQYLHQLAHGLGISQQACNHIHQQAGAPVLYS
ncbi:MAG TPA: DUF533 domain-containing protein [Gammaproteobacteria bacterium]|nr:DUF533 domain-containing protein [Gammaproteobacteria bacterium]